MVGEEITAADYHLLGVGITETVSAGCPCRAIEEVHGRGGVAIAAHPYKNAWPAFDAPRGTGRRGSGPAGSPERGARLAGELRAFSGARSRLRASSQLSATRITMGWVRWATPAPTSSRGSAPLQGVLDAVRDGRTVVYDRDLVFGDPSMIKLAAATGGLPHEVPVLPTSRSRCRLQPHRDPPAARRHSGVEPLELTNLQVTVRSLKFEV